MARTVINGMNFSEGLLETIRGEQSGTIDIQFGTGIGTANIRKIIEALQDSVGIQNITLGLSVLAPDEQWVVVEGISELGVPGRAVTVLAENVTGNLAGAALDKLKQGNPGLRINRFSDGAEQAVWLYRLASELPQANPGRDELFLEALNTKIAADRKEAEEDILAAGTSGLFSMKNQVPYQAVRNVITIARRGTDVSLDNRTEQEKAAGDERRHTQQDAKRLLIEAFSELDPAMGPIIGEAFEQGRVSFAPSIYRAHADFIGRSTQQPQGLPDMPDWPYVSVPLPSGEELLSDRDLLHLAHEIGHLVAFQRSFMANNPPSQNIILHETFAVLGECLLYDYMMRDPHTDMQRGLELREIYNDDMDRAIFHSAAIVTLRDQLEAKIRVTGRPLNHNDVAAVMQDMSTGPNASAIQPDDWHSEHLMLSEPYYSLSYIYAYALANHIMGMHEAQLLAGETPPTSIARYLTFVQEAGIQVLLPDFMRALGREPTDTGFIGRAITAHEEDSAYYHALEGKVASYIAQNQGQLPPPDEIRRIVGAEDFRLNLIHPQEPPSPGNTVGAGARIPGGPPGTSLT